jgi:hypothetical protein
MDAVYERRGWDKNSIPALEKLHELGMDLPELLEVIEEAKKKVRISLPTTNIANSRQYLDGYSSFLFLLPSLPAIFFLSVLLPNSSFILCRV